MRAPEDVPLPVAPQLAWVTEIGENERIALSHDIRPKVILRHRLNLDVVYLHLGIATFLMILSDILSDIYIGICPLSESFQRGFVALPMFVTAPNLLKYVIKFDILLIFSSMESSPLISGIM